MFLIKANTVIQIQTPKSIRSFNWSSWIPHKTNVDKIYDKEEVYDYLRVSKSSGDIPYWIIRNVLEFGKVVITRDGKFALVNTKDIEYLD